MRKTKKAQGLPINIIVMIIIGIVIFGLGISMFFKFSGAGEDRIDDLNNQIRTGISDLECDGGDAICAPSFDLGNGKSGNFELTLSNSGNDNGEFKVEFNGINNNEFEKTGCGTIKVYYPKDISVEIQSGESAKYPFIVEASRVTKTPCSFILTANMLDNNNKNIGSTSVIVKIK